MSEVRSPTLGASRAQDDPVSGILTFIFADLILFAMLFAGFMVERARDLALFDASSRSLDVNLGLLNLLILVTSGLCIVFGVDAARHGNARRTRKWVLAAFVIGAGFCISKAFEYGSKFERGISMMTNDFYMYYYALTGAHFLHFLGGMGALAYVWFQCGRQDVRGPFYSKVEAVGLYWHMVDLLWILIFPLLYLLGTAWHV
jgi:nitric oxide reductase NorE protein